LPAFAGTLKPRVCVMVDRSAPSGRAGNRLRGTAGGTIWPISMAPRSRVQLAGKPITCLRRPCRSRGRV